MDQTGKCTQTQKQRNQCNSGKNMPQDKSWRRWIIDTIIDDLFCTHEEADTRIFLHAEDMSKRGYTDVVIRSPDTDVEVIAIHFQQRISARLTFVSGTKDKLRIVDVPALVNKLGSDVCAALPGLHALTGCDSWSAFFGKGKKTALGVIQNDQEICKGLALLGVSQTVSASLHSSCEQFTIHLYGSTAADINTARFELFCKKNLQSQSLPPTADALQKHVERVNHQVYLWKQSLAPQPAISSPIGKGWELCNNKLSIKWMTRSPAPISLMELVSCSCKTPCATRRCSCQHAGLPCTPACKCGDHCINKAVQSTSDSEDE